MIQVIGNLTTIDGLIFKDPLININLFSPSKFQPVKANLLIGRIEEIINPDETTIPFFKSIYDLITFNYLTSNTEFLYIEGLVISDLQLLFQDCTFEQI
jgi:hypothetical protein